MMIVVDPALARRIWHRMETLNAVAYFSEECRRFAAELGLKGFWMGYFASRAAPMGPVAPGVVEATFFNFHPSRVHRAIPDAWDLVSPSAVVVARSAAAGDALRRLLGGSAVAELNDAVLPALEDVIGCAAPAGLPLFAANKEVPHSDDPGAALWQALTTLREHRGDQHVNLLATAGLDGCEALVLFSLSEGISPERIRQSRGWSAEEWLAAAGRLRKRALVSEDGELSRQGRELRSEIEARTDELAIAPYESLGEGGVAELLGRLAGPARVIAAADEIAYPNPMGLPRFSQPE